MISVGDLVYHLAHDKSNHESWMKAVVVKRVRRSMYLIEKDYGRRAKAHVSLLKERTMRSLEKSDKTYNGGIDSNRESNARDKDWIMVSGKIERR